MKLEDTIKAYDEACTVDALRGDINRAEYNMQIANWLRELQSIREIVRDTDIEFDKATDHEEMEEAIDNGYSEIEKVIQEDKGYQEWIEEDEDEF